MLNSTITPIRSETLSQRELYLFDTTGLLWIPNFLTQEDVEIFRRAVFSCPPRVMAGRGDKVRYDDLARQSPLLGKFAATPAIRNCVEPLINQPFRLIESYGLYRQKDSVFYLHNGMSEHISYGDGRRVARNMGFNHTYHDGKLYCTFVKCLVYLNDVKTDGDGAFCYIQGSHKANFPWFPGTIDESGRPALTRANFPTLATLSAAAGDIVLLNEALMHGTLPKTTEGDRLVAAFSYAPCFIADWTAADIKSPDIHRAGHF